jgi:hypothetical protein
MHPWDGKTITLNEETEKMEVTGVILDGVAVSCDDFNSGIQTDF